MTPDPLRLLDQLEAAHRARKPGAHPDPRQIEPWLTVLARAIVSPDRVAGPSMDYRPRSARDALLSRAAKLYGASVRSLRSDLVGIIDAAQAEAVERDRADEVERLERAYGLEARDPGRRPGEWHAQPNKMRDAVDEAFEPKRLELEPGPAADVRWLYGDADDPGPKDGRDWQPDLRRPDPPTGLYL